MHRVMVFIDYQNFYINLHDHCKGGPIKKINYTSLGKALIEYIPFQADLMKTYVFAYKPCDELMRLEKYQKYYDWLNRLKSSSYLEVIEGRQEIRLYKDVKYDINDHNTYYTEEKETDINLATHMLAKGFQNAYDIAILVSGDTDYIKVIETLHNIGKIVVVAHFPHQNVSRYDGLCDAKIILYDNILDKASFKKDNDKEQD